MEENNINTKMYGLTISLKKALKPVDDVLESQLVFCSKHLIDKCFHVAYKGAKREYFCFIEVSGGHNCRKGVVLRFVRVITDVADTDKYVYHISSACKPFETIINTFGKGEVEEISFNKFEEIYRKALELINDDLRVAFYANQTPQAEEGNCPTNENKEE